MPDIHTIDLHWLGQPQSIAAFVLRGRGGSVLIETGPASTVETLARGLADIDLRPDEIEHVLVSHIHLDHAGAAWWLAERGATIHVHELGAPHLIDPARLFASAERIYGNQMQRLWGELKPIDAGQVNPVRDGDVLELNGLRLEAIETPGHARHHHAFALLDEAERICFTGDAAAMFVPGVDTSKFISLPTPPPEFDLHAWMTSIDRLDARRFDALYLTHFGRLDGAGAHCTALRRCLRAHARFVIDLAERGLEQDEIVRRYGTFVSDEARRAGLSDEMIQRHVGFNLVSMNVTGILRYHERQLAEAGA